MTDSSDEEVGKETSPQANVFVGRDNISSPTRKLIFMTEEKKEDSDSDEGDDEDSKDDEDDDSQESSENKRVDEKMADQSEKETEMKPASSSSLFSKKDEITLLEEFIEYKKMHDDRNNDWVKFHQAVGSKLSNEFTRRQISEKIRRMKDKFKRNCKNKFPHLDGSHEARVFELSKSLWGKHPSMEHRNDDDLDTCSKDVASTCKKKYVQGENLDQSDYPFLRIFFNDASLPEIIRRKWTLIGSENAEKLERQYIKLFKRELSLSLEMNGFKAEVSGLISKIIKHA